MSINTKTVKSPTITARVPCAMESAPRLGPTILSSIIFTGAGRAPALNIIARSFASFMLANPSICVLPPGIFSLIDGAMCTFWSRTIAILSPTFEPVTRDHVLEPSLFIERETTG